MKLAVRSDWSTAILVCAKCSKKLGGGFGEKGRLPLVKALRKHLGLGKGRKARAGVVEVKCLGICPKGAVAVVDTARLAQWTLVPAGANLDEVQANLQALIRKKVRAVDRDALVESRA